MGNKIVFDLDGVMRDLMGYCHDRFDVTSPTEWFWKHNGKDVYRLVKEDNYNALIYSPPTKYLSTIKKYSKKLEIWSHQPPKWRSYTKHWLDYYLGEYSIRYLTTKQKRARLDKHKDTWLVEDNPNFKSYKRIILIDRLYNRNVDCYRVKTSSKLNKVLNYSRR